MQRHHVHLEMPLLHRLKWLGRRWVGWMLSPGLTLLPKAAESRADLGTHQEPPLAQQPLCKATSRALWMLCTALEKLLPGHGLLLQPFPWDPALPFPPQELPWDSGNSLFPPGWPGAPALPTPALENTTPTRGQETPRGQRSCVEQAHGREAVEWGGTHRRKPPLAPLAPVGDIVLPGERPPDQTSN